MNTRLSDIVFNMLPIAAQAGVPPLDFYRMTYREVMAMIEAYKQNQKMDDHRAARICFLIAETNRNPKTRPKAYRVNDFMPQEKKHNKEQTPEQMLNVLRAMFGGRVKAGDK